MSRFNPDTYCRDCDRSIYGKYPDSCDINIENNGKYVRGESPCYCKITNGKMAEKYPWELRAEEEGEQDE